jgi:hypothetical protein
MGAKLIATYLRDTKRYHLYTIDEGQEVTGSIYVPKDSEIPNEVTIELRVKENPQPNAYLNPGAQ